jgi:hypothetical protein
MAYEQRGERDFGGQGGGGGGFDGGFGRGRGRRESSSDVLVSGSKCLSEDEAEFQVDSVWNPVNDKILFLDQNSRL